MLARHLGARVSGHPQGYHEIGYYSIRATDAGRGLFAGEQQFYQWHGEGFDLPAGAELLAEGEAARFPNQAFRLGKAYGIQFHPEVTREMMCRWTRFAAHRMVLAGAQARDTHLRGHSRYDRRVEDWTRMFERLRRAGLSVAALSTAAVSIDLCDYRVPERVALTLGSERDGLRPETLAAADTRIRIPIAEDVDSLNIATASGIALHHISQTS